MQKYFKIYMVEKDGNGETRFITSGSISTYFDTFEEAEYHILNKLNRNGTYTIIPYYSE